jgi:hypothetical protein
MDESKVFTRNGQVQDPAQHLLVQRCTLGGPRHDNAVHRGLVKAFGEDRTVGDHACLAGVQALEEAFR